MTWILFREAEPPLWDGAAVEDAGTSKLPLGEGSAEKIVVKYASDGGYSPGDTWELYVGTDGRIIYSATGAPPPEEIAAAIAEAQDE